MKKYKKNPIEVEALQWDGSKHRDMYNFLTEYKRTEDSIEPFNEDFRIDFTKGDGGLVIKTSEGDMFANIGDYIIKEPFDKERKFYPCKKDIFERTYTEV